MNTNLPTIKFTNPDLHARDPSLVELLKGWLSVLLSSPTTLVLLAILTTTVLMLAFHQIVLGAVEQGKLLQQARNLQSETLYRCKSLPTATARNHCLRQAHQTTLAEARR